MARKRTKRAPAPAKMKLDELPTLEGELPSGQRGVAVLGYARKLGTEFVAVRMYTRGGSWVVIHRSFVEGARLVEETAHGPIAELHVRAGTPVSFLSAGDAAGAAPWQPAGQPAPFVMATPHHVAMSYNPPALGGNIPVHANLWGGGLQRQDTGLSDPITLPEGQVPPPAGGGGEAEEGEDKPPTPAPEAGTDSGEGNAETGTTWLNDRITIPEGPAGPPEEPTPPTPTPSPTPAKGTDWLNDRITLPEGPVGAEPPPLGPVGPPPPPVGKGTDFMNDPITLPEGPVGPPPAPVPPPRPPLKGTDYLNDHITLPEGPVGPPPKDPWTDFGPPPVPLPPKNQWTDHWPGGPPFPYPPPGAKGTDWFNDRVTVPPYAEGPVAPDPQDTSPVWDVLRKFTGQFGDPWGLDYTWDY